MAKAERDGTGVGKFLLGFVFAFVTLFLGAFMYLKYGNPPVAAADPAFPMEAQIVHVPLGARVARELKPAPFAASEEGLQAGAHVYKSECAACHGTPGQDVAYAKWMYPQAPQLWKKHGNSDVVGVSDDEVGETYWKVDNGIRLTGMPAYQHILSEEQMWQVSLLLKNADKALSPVVMAILVNPVNPLPTPVTK